MAVDITVTQVTDQHSHHAPFLVAGHCDHDHGWPPGCTWVRLKMQYTVPLKTAMCIGKVVMNNWIWRDVISEQPIELNLGRSVGERLPKEICWFSLGQWSTKGGLSFLVCSYLGHQGKCTMPVETSLADWNPQPLTCPQIWLRITCKIL